MPGRSHPAGDAPPGLFTELELRDLVERVAAIRRPSASAGEAEAAQLVSRELAAAGARVRTETERAHGTYWWPIGLPAAAAALAGLRRSRAGALLALACAAAAADDMALGRRWLRRLLPQRETVNVVAELGSESPEAPTVLFVAHHDAAHSGAVFDPRIPRAWARRFPRLLERTNTTPPVLWGAVAGPLLVTLGSLLGLRRTRLLGATVCAGYVAAMADIGLREVVPGANDNATGVAVLASLARALAAGEAPGARVMLLSTGSEESFMEGMHAFARRHFADLPRDRTHVVCLDTVGSPRLALLEGEGMLAINDYPGEPAALIRDCAARSETELVLGLRFHNATDALVALKAGYPTAMLGSVDELKAPSNYHWPSDTAANVDYGTVAATARLCLAVSARLAAAESPPAGARSASRREAQSLSS